MTQEITLDSVVKYIYARSLGTYMHLWLESDIKKHVLDLIVKQHIRIHDDGSKIDGLIIFDPNCCGRFLVRQVWCANKYVMIDFLKALKHEYPFTTEVYGSRKGRRKNVKFNLETLTKIFYGSRRTGTATTRVNSQNAGLIRKELPHAT